MRLGIFGGSFDPIHRGHVEPVLQAREELGLDRVLYLPTATPPHKQGREMAPAWSRYAMVELALLGHAELRVDPREMTIERPSYTIETLETLAAESEDTELFLIVGEDSLAALPSWRRGLEIPKVATVVSLRRPDRREGGTDRALPVELAADLEAGRIVRLESDPCPVSSTEIRRRLAIREPGPVPGVAPLVLDYILKYSLYD